jgi:hypothetical protein
MSALLQKTLKVVPVPLSEGVPTAPPVLEVPNPHLHAYRCKCCGHIDWLTEDCSLYCPRCTFWPIERMRSKKIGAILTWLQSRRRGLRTVAR